MMIPPLVQQIKTKSHVHVRKIVPGCPVTNVHIVAKQIRKNRLLRMINQVMIKKRNVKDARPELEKIKKGTVFQ